MHDSWCSDGFQVNTTSFHVTEHYFQNVSYPTTVWAAFTNRTGHDAFNVNSTLTYAGNELPPGCGSGSFHLGQGPFWFVYIHTIPKPAEVSFTISVQPD